MDTFDAFLHSIYTPIGSGDLDDPGLLTPVEDDPSVPPGLQDCEVIAENPMDFQPNGQPGVQSEDRVLNSHPQLESSFKADSNNYKFEQKPSLSLREVLVLREKDAGGVSLSSELDPGSDCDSDQTNCTSLDPKTTWEFVKERIRQIGVNQACKEISELGQNLSKIAKGTFHQILEIEIETLDGSYSDLIKVETPLISHLLDLPFGTYVIKEEDFASDFASDFA